MLEGNTLKAKLVENTSSVGALGFKGERGYSNYELAVQNGYIGTEQEWLDHFGVDLTDYIKTTDIVNNVTTNNSQKPLSAAQGRYLKNYIDTYRENEIGETTDLETTSKIVVNAINEVNTSINNTGKKIGNLSSLTTTNKTSVVKAINEVNSLVTTKTYCRFGTTTNVTLLNAYTDYKIQLDRQQYNNGFTINNGAIICPKNGVICLSAAVMMSEYNGYAGLKIRQNGVQIFDTYATKPSVDYGEIVSPMYTFPVAKDDTIELYVMSDAANDTTSNSTRTGVNIFYI